MIFPRERFRRGKRSYSRLNSFVSFRVQSETTTTLMRRQGSITPEVARFLSRCNHVASTKRTLDSNRSRGKRDYSLFLFSSNARARPRYFHSLAVIFAAREKGIGWVGEKGWKCTNRIFLPEDSLLPSWPLPRVSRLSTSVLDLAFTRTTTTSSSLSGGGGGGGGGGFDRLQWRP